jgi:hypothetical protein
MGFERMEGAFLELKMAISKKIWGKFSDEILLEKYNFIYLEVNKK